MTVEQEQGNRIIGLFMDGKFLHPQNPDYITFKNVSFGDMVGDYSCHIKGLYFHSNWSWIMPVAIAIKNIPPIKGKVIVQINKFEELVESLMKMDIEKLWNAIVDFITWYNTTIKK